MAESSFLQFFSCSLETSDKAGRRYRIHLQTSAQIRLHFFKGILDEAADVGRSAAYLLPLNENIVLFIFWFW